MMRRILMWCLGGALAGVAIFAVLSYLSAPEEVYILSISTNSRAPANFTISDYKRLGDHWLWYKERNGPEVTINLHSSQVIIQRDPPKQITNLFEIRENILGIGTYLDSALRGAPGAT